MTTRVYAGETASERVTRRRAALIDTAISVIAERGWRELRVEHVCKRAGLVKRYFYESFTDLDELTTAVIDQISTDMLAATFDRAGDSPLGADFTRAALTGLVDHVTADPRGMRVLFGEMSATDSASAVRMDAVRRLASAVEKVGYTAGGTSNNDPTAALTASMLIGGIIQTLQDWVGGHIDMTKTRLIDDLTALVTATGDTAIRRLRAAGSQAR